MQITMLQTSRGSEDSFSVREHKEGVQYDLADGLAKRFLKAGVAYNSEPEPEQPTAGSSAFERCMYELAMAQRDLHDLRDKGVL